MTRTYWCPVGKHFWTLKDMTQVEQLIQKALDRVCPEHAVAEEGDFCDGI